MLRTFVALELPAEVKHAVAAAQDRAVRAVRWADPESAHLTLKFLGPTPEDAVARVDRALARAARGTGPLRLRTAELGCFPDRRSPRVLWLGLDGDLERLGALRDAIEREVSPLGWPTEPRPFAPHLTLGRLRSDTTPAERRALGEALAGMTPPAPVAFAARELSLMRSDLSPKGARYSRLLAVPL